MKVNKINTNKGIREFLTISKDEVCPICGKVPYGFSWNMLHGEVTSSCCGIALQIKDYYIDENEPQEYKDFVESIGSDKTGYVINIDNEWIKPLNKAIKKIGICNIRDEEVFEYAKRCKGV